MRFVDAPPPREATLALYDSVRWTGYTRDPERLLHAIAHSTYVTSAWDGERLVGLARAISDEATVWFLQDLLVPPDRQRTGLGRALLDRCHARFENVSRGVLLTEDDTAPFYERQGWERARTRGVVTCWVNRSLSPDGPPSPSQPPE